MDTTGPDAAERAHKRKRKRKRTVAAAGTDPFTRSRKTPKTFSSPFDGLVGRKHFPSEDLCNDPEDASFDRDQFSDAQYCTLIHDSYMKRSMTDKDVYERDDFRRDRTRLSRDAAAYSEEFKDVMDTLGAHIVSRDDYSRNDDERVRVAIPDTYTRWHATEHEALAVPCLDTDACLLFDDRARNAIQALQPWRDWQQFVGTMRTARASGDLGPSRLTKKRVRRIHRMGFLPGMLAAGDKGPDPRYRTRFLIMTNPHPFGLYLFSNTEDVFVYGMFVAENCML